MNKFFYNMNEFGGTEYMVKNVNEKILPKLKNIPKYNLIVGPGPAFDILDVVNKKNIIWLHNTPSQFHPDFNALVLSPAVQEKTVYFIVPSNFAKDVWISAGLIGEKIKVIHNAIDISEKPTINKSSDKKINIIYTSNEYRGLELLLRSTDYFDFDFNLEVFGGFRPGETTFFGENESGFWIPKLKNYEKITFYGKSVKKTLYKHIKKSDLMIYPSIFLETFCLSAVESIAFGKPLITTEYGALKEILEDDAQYVYFDKRLDEYIKSEKGPNLYAFSYQFPKIFLQAVKNIAIVTNEFVKNMPHENELKEKALKIQEKYSWETISKQWIDLDSQILDNN